MTSFEDKILASAKIRAKGINPSNFISNLRAKQVYESNRKKTIRSGFSAFAFIFLISIITFNQLENPKSNLATDIISEDGVVLGKYFFENRSKI